MTAVDDFSNELNTLSAQIGLLNFFVILILVQFSSELTTFWPLVSTNYLCVLSNSFALRRHRVFYVLHILSLICADGFLFAFRQLALHCTALHRTGPALQARDVVLDGCVVV